ncbi:protein ripply2-like [Pleurodeles waltl]|uniref:protein ripply2-like n=1 Tax=Pleurodeles waltl TaxID=8319 RepID=UPI003709529C
MICNTNHNCSMKEPRLASRPVPARRSPCCHCQRPVRPSQWSEGFWRPWLSSRRDSERLQARKTQRLPCGPLPGKHGSYNHPVRLFWPKSKCSPHLYEAGEALLSSFPVQATISFYEESDSESEADSSDESHDSGIDSE